MEKWLREQTVALDGGATSHQILSLSFRKGKSVQETQKVNETRPFQTLVFLLELFLLGAIVFAPSSAQDYTTKFERDSKTGEQIPIGFTPRRILADTLYRYHNWFDKGYSRYKPDVTVSERLKEAFTDDIDLLVFYGTWCSDTQRELPRLMKILDTVGFPERRLKLCAVDRAKQSGDAFAKHHKVKRVATVIIFRNGEELGRIIESPKVSLEFNMLQLLKGEVNEAE